MRNIFCFLIILSLFSLLGMFSAAFAARVYVMGSPTVLPTSNNTLPVEIRVENRSTDGYVLLALETTSAMNGQCTNSPLNSNDTSADLVLLKSDNTGSEWSDLGTGVLNPKEVRGSERHSIRKREPMPTVTMFLSKIPVK